MVSDSLSSCALCGGGWVWAATASGAKAAEWPSPLTVITGRPAPEPEEFMLATSLS